MSVAIRLIIYEAYMKNLFIFKVKIVITIKWSYSPPLQKKKKEKKKQKKKDTHIDY